MTLLQTLLFIAVTFGMLLVVAAGAAGSTLPAAGSGHEPRAPHRPGLL